MKLKIFLILIIININLASAAHFIVGYVEDANDSTSPNGRTVRVWNETTGDEVFGIIGPTGDSAISNFFLVDCELFSTPCVVGDILNVTVTNDGSGYIATNNLQVTVTGFGFDLTGNLTINSPPTFENLTLEDIFTSPLNELDLTPNTTTSVSCSGVITEYDGENNLISVAGEIYNSTSFIGDSDDNNTHYTNSSCIIDNSFGDTNTAGVSCSFDVQYYASAGTWECFVNVTDSPKTSSNLTDTSLVNTLLSLSINSPVDFTGGGINNYTEEETVEVVNLGNTVLNLGLSGYGAVEEDGYSMNCTVGNISVIQTKFNLTDSSPGLINFAQAESSYSNLSTAPQTETFSLYWRQNEATNEARNDTYWRVFIPESVSGGCDGNIVFGATQG